MIITVELDIIHQRNHKNRLFAEKISNFMLDIYRKSLIIITSNDVSNMEEYL